MSTYSAEIVSLTHFLDAREDLFFSVARDERVALYALLRELKQGQPQDDVPAQIIERISRACTAFGNAILGYRAANEGASRRFQPGDIVWSTKKKKMTGVVKDVHRAHGRMTVTATPDFMTKDFRAVLPSSLQRYDDLSPEHRTEADAWRAWWKEAEAFAKTIDTEIARRVCEEVMRDERVAPRIAHSASILRETFGRKRDYEALVRERVQEKICQQTMPSKLRNIFRILLAPDELPTPERRPGLLQETLRDAMKQVLMGKDDIIGDARADLFSKLKAKS
ncbi:MAG: hypothetical protein V1926_01645 [Candidatus Peregrinibacteria bacterium]